MFGYWILFIICVVIAVVAYVLTFVKIFYLDRNKGWGYISDWHIASCIIAVVTTVIAFIFMIMSICMPLNAHKDYITYSNLYDIYYQKAEMLNSNSDTLNAIGQNRDLIRDIDKYNVWLAAANASKSTYSIFSSYYKEDLENLDYIYLFKGE